MALSRQVASTREVRVRVVEIDLATVAEFEAEMAPTGGAEHLVLDMSDVEFIDASGVRALVVADAALTDAGGRLQIRNARRSVARVLEIVGRGDLLGT